jgi:hypothetical protein
MGLNSEEFVNVAPTPKLYCITYERFPEPGGEGYLDFEYRVFDSKRAAERYAREVVAVDNAGYDKDAFCRFQRCPLGS